LKAALTSKKKHNKRRKPLDLQQRQEYHSRTIFWSPDKIQEAQARRVVIECEEHERQLQKANNKELKAAAKLYKEKIAEEKRVAQEAAKVLKEKERTEKAAKHAARMEAQNTNKSLQTSQVGKRKASQASEPKAKRTQRLGDSLDVAGSLQAAPAAPAKVNSCGRTINLPGKYK
jgi:rubrerythrin